MQQAEFEDLNIGDVVQNNRTGLTFVVIENSMSSEGQIVVTRTVCAQNPEEWTRRRKTVDVEG